MPRIAFVNKLDREGANPEAVTEQLRSKLKLNAAMIQVPIGLSAEHVGVCDLVELRATTFEGPNGDQPTPGPIPAELKAQVQAKRAEMLERLAECDEEIAEYYINEEEPPLEVLRAAIRRQTIANTFTPVMMGSAFKNKGVQTLLDGVVHYLPNPREVSNVGLDLKNDEAQVDLSGKAEDPFVGLAFKLEEGRFGQLTYMRIYQGSLARGQSIISMVDKKKVRVPKLVRMNSNDMEDVEVGQAGDIVAMFGVDCASGTTFTDGQRHISMTSMFVPDPVISLSLTPKNRNHPNFTKAIGRFTKEDPTFRVHTDDESNECIISGMGELHLEVYVERLKREYNCECTTGQPKVAFRETPSTKSKFVYTHKKQSGGSGQFGRIEGFIEPIDEELGSGTFEFENRMIGNSIPPDFLPAIEKGFREGIERGAFSGYPILGVRVVVEDGLAHAVDSNEMSFKLAAKGALREAMKSSKPVVLEPIMSTEVIVPSEYQGAAVALVSQRKGVVSGMEGTDFVSVQADMPLDNMFGFSSELRGATQGKGEYSMEYRTHLPCMKDKQEEIVKKWAESAKGKKSNSDDDE